MAEIPSIGQPRVRIYGAIRRSSAEARRRGPPDIARSDWWAGSFGVLDNADAEQAAWLIQRGAVVDIHAAAGLGMLDKVRPSVLMVAAKYGGQEIYDLLFNRSPVTEQFLAACRLVDEATARKLLAANPGLIQELPAEGRAQIVDAAFSHDLPALELMLRLGFDVNTRGGEGFTPVAHAALRGDAGIVRLLIQRGADLEIRNDCDGTALESCQWGSLNFCDRAGDYPDCAEALLQGGATLSEPDFGSEAVKAVLRRYA